MSVNVGTDPAHYVRRSRRSHRDVAGFAAGGETRRLLASMRATRYADPYLLPRVAATRPGASR
jgi:hypothetical protein